MNAWKLPASASAFIVTVAGLGTVATIVSAHMSWQYSLKAEAWIALPIILTVLTWLQVRSFNLVIGGRRVCLHPDEGVLMVAVMLLPLPHVMLAAGMATLAGQLFLRRALPKFLFNYGSQLASTGLGIIAFATLCKADIDPVLATAVIPLTVSAANHVLISALFTRLQGERVFSAFSLAIVPPIAIATGGGTFLGFLAIALYQLHPALVLGLAPTAWLGLEAMNAGYQHENELTAQRAFRAASLRTLRSRSESSVHENLLEACVEAFAAYEASYTPLHGPPIVRKSNDVPPSRCTRVSSTVHGADGEPIGTLAIYIRRQPRTAVAHEQHFLDAAASQLSLALANVRLIASLESSERRVRSVLDAAPEPILMLSRSGETLYANPSALREAAATAAYLASADATRLRGSRLEFSAANHDWESNETLLSPGNPDASVIVMMRNVTHRKRLEEERRRHEQQLARTERLVALGTLVAGVAHEINNPLTYMTGGIDLVLLDLKDLEHELGSKGTTIETISLPEVTQQLETVRSGAMRIASITKDLKVIARASQETRLKPLSMAHVAREVTALVAPSLAPSTTMSLAVHAEPIVIASGDALSQVVVNLVKNALEAIDQDGGHVTITVDATTTEALLSVNDNGPGIPEDVQPRLFTPFYTTKRDGTGLGLSTALAIIRGHGGTIDVDTRAGHGTKFTIRLPLRGDESGGGAEHVETHGPQPGAHDDGTRRGWRPTQG